MVDIDKRVDTAIRHAVRQRNYRRVRDRALARLRKLYPDQYRELFEEERERDEKENKAWLDIAGNTHASVGASTPHSAGKVSNGHSDRGEEGEL